MEEKTKQNINYKNTFYDHWRFFFIFSKYKVTKLQIYNSELTSTARKVQVYNGLRSCSTILLFKLKETFIKNKLEKNAP